MPTTTTTGGTTTGTVLPVLPSPISVAPIKRYVTFSGGGWNSHSFLAGMVSGALDALQKSNQPRTLSTLLQGVEGIAANSGGSWFMTMLAYSKPFRQAFESLATTNSFKTSGYLGQLRELFQPSFNAVTPSLTTLPLLSGILEQAGPAVSSAVNWIDYYRNLIGSIAGTGLNWRNVVEQVVYGPYNMVSSLSSLRLTGPRESWAANMDLLYATALHSAPVVMETKGILRDKVFTKTTNPVVGSTSSFTPMTISSEVVTAGTTPLAKAILTAGSASVETSNNAIAVPFVYTPPGSVAKTVASVLTANGLNVMDPTVASSSAAAMVAAPNSWAQRYLPGSLLGGLRNELGELTKDLAPIGQMRNGALTMPRTLPISSDLQDSVNKISSGVYTRMADGGYLDNQAAANMLRHIQDTDGTSKPFNLTVFANTSSDPLTGIRMKTGTNQLSSFTLPSDVASLFGNSNGLNNDGDIINFPDFGFNIKVPSNKIFDANAWLNERADWSTTSGNIDISVYKLNVTTVANKAYGIKPGQTGTVNLFVARNKFSGPAPFQPAYLDSYDQNFDVFRNAISTGGAYPYIKEALGLT